MKYPKTMHLPLSPNLQNDDRRIDTLEHLKGKNVIWTEKLDGENTSMHSDRIHARSEENDSHPSRNWVKGLWGSIKHNIPSNIQICGESMYACHSIFYDRLDTFFYVFGIVDKDRKVFLSVDDTIEWCKKLGLEYSPILKRGIFEEDFDMPDKSAFSDEIEGYVVRLTEEISLEEWKYKAAKFVRSKHVTSNDHWKKTWKPNKLSEKKENE